MGAVKEDSIRCQERGFGHSDTICKLAKGQVRFVFCRADTTLAVQKNPAAILDKIADYAELVKLTRRIDRNTKLFRCRTHETDRWLTSREDFAPPPAEKASAGRMNAAGINVFYLTLDPETALMETDVQGRDFASIASFRVRDAVTVLDLTKIKSMKLPSVFDEENRDKRSPILFLQKFAESISQQTDLKEIDYVPTQIVTEYFRYVKSSHPGGYAGILYDSAKNPGGKCLALFLSREDVLNEKYGIHLLPKATTYYKKRFEQVQSRDSYIAKGKLFVESIGDQPLSSLVDGNLAIHIASKQ